MTSRLSNLAYVSATYTLTCQTTSHCIQLSAWFEAITCAGRLHEHLRKDLSLAEEVTHFAGQAKSMTSALRHRSLSALIAALPARKHQLFQGSPNSQPTHFLPQAEEAVWKLV